MSDARKQARKIAGPLVVILGLAGLPGCGGIDGVNFEGKLFDAVGLSGALGKKDEPKTEARAPLVMPPTTQSLPEPGAVAAAPANAPPADPAWPNDPDQRKFAKADAASKAQKKFCSDGNWKEKAMQDELAARDGPAGDCTGSLFSVLAKQLSGE